MRRQQQKAMFARLAREECRSSQQYHRLGFHSIARDESRHSKIMARRAKVVIKGNWRAKELKLER